MQPMTRVKYIGKFDSMTCDYNGKRYCFRARERISIIPTVVYDFIKQQKDVLSMDLIATQDDLQVKEQDDQFVSLPLKEYTKLSKEDKEVYKAKKAKAESKNV